MLIVTAMVVIFVTSAVIAAMTDDDWIGSFFFGKNYTPPSIFSGHSLITSKESDFGFHGCGTQLEEPELDHVGRVWLPA